MNKYTKEDIITVQKVLNGEVDINQYIGMSVYHSNGYDDVLKHSNNPNCKWAILYGFKNNRFVISNGAKHKFIIPMTKSNLIREPYDFTDFATQKRIFRKEYSSVIDENGNLNLVSGFDVANGETVVVLGNGRRYNNIEAFEKLQWHNHTVFGNEYIGVKK